jgi:hypothetical protein
MASALVCCSKEFPLADVSQRVMKIFVGGLAPEVTDASFREYFSKFGTITDSTVCDTHLLGFSYC